MADLKRGDNINVMRPSPNGSALARLCKSEKVELCCPHPLGDWDIIGFLDGWVKHILEVCTHPYIHTPLFVSS